MEPFSVENITMRSKKSLRKSRQPQSSCSGTEIVFLVEEAPEGGYTAQAAGVPIFTEADNLRQLHALVRDAVRCHFDKTNFPRIIRLHFIHEEVLAV